LYGIGFAAEVLAAAVVGDGGATGLGVDSHPVRTAAASGTAAIAALRSHHLSCIALTPVVSRWTRRQWRAVPRR